MTLTDLDDSIDPIADHPSAHYRAIAAAIHHLATHYEDRPSLDELAAAAGMSPFHFQRVFKRWAGISPKRFAQYVTLGHARRLLAENRSVLDTALDVGLSGPSRLHDLFVVCEAMTPGEYKVQGQGLTIRWGLHDSPFGRMLIGTTARGLCWLGFVVDGDEAAAVAEFAAAWAAARRVEDPAATAPVAARAIALEAAADPGAGGTPLRLLLRGTNFEIKVWEALLRLPAGTVASYRTIAAAIGQPTATRAVGNAMGRNPIAMIIPCHRVIRQSGVLHGYRWGAARKRALLAWEAARRDLWRAEPSAEPAAPSTPDAPPLRRGS